jgi:hypothetical protein
VPLAKADCSWKVTATIWAGRLSREGSRAEMPPNTRRKDDELTPQEPAMIFMSQSGLIDPSRNADWDAWYLDHLRVMVSVKGIESAQRFRTATPGCSPSLAMYSMESAAVFADPYYLSIRGLGEFRAITTVTCSPAWIWRRRLRPSRCCSSGTGNHRARSRGSSLHGWKRLPWTSRRLFAASP